MLCNLFLHEKVVEILLAILSSEENGEKIYPLQISNSINSPYSYVSKVLNEFEKNCIIESKFEGRTRVLKLTEYGKKIATILKELKELLERDVISEVKLGTLKRIFENGQKDFYSIAPILAELELLMSETKNESVVKEAIELRRRLEELIC
ncbi:MAG: ArsR family transcriptional regulator [Archaeoglobaceae archaeon]|nr:ArsR family transcriptional regulator [Archaeoglobaceae archaeon]MDW7989494.1 ArsR family transcriptional regulator [Archaeoglobaceae archaeon]